MPVFEYIAKASPQEIVHGELFAETAEALATRLVDGGLHPLSILPTRDERALQGGWLTPRKQRIPKGALVLITRQLASMLAAGMTAHGAISFLATQAAPGALKGVLNGMRERLEEGERLSEACASFPGVFSDFYANMIRAGETGGMLELVLDHLAELLEKEDDLRKQVRSALAYPALMMLMGTITVSILVTFVVPKIVSMFDEMGQVLPWSTRVLMLVSGTLANNWWMLVLLLVALMGMARAAATSSEFRLKLDRMKLRLPFLGPLLVEAEVTQFARTLGALMAHGVPVHRAFEVVIAACKNVVLREELRDAGSSILRGERIGVSMLNCTHMPSSLSEMLTVAEDTNQIEPILERIARTGTKEVERSISVFTRLLEPVMIVVVGGIIGFVVFAMMLPIFDINFVVQ